MVISLSMWPPRRRPNKTESRTAPKPFISDFVSETLFLRDIFRISAPIVEVPDSLFVFGTQDSFMLRSPTGVKRISHF